MCRYFCIGFIDRMLKGKSLLKYKTLLSFNDYEKNDEMILKYFQQNLNKLKCIVMLVVSLLIAYRKCGHEYKTFKEEESFEILKTLGLASNKEEYQKP